MPPKPPPPAAEVIDRAPAKDAPATGEGAGREFVLEGGPVEERDFAPAGAVRLWEYGAGDAVRVPASIMPPK